MRFNEKILKLIFKAKIKSYDLSKRFKDKITGYIQILGKV